MLIKNNNNEGDHNTLPLLPKTILDLTDITAVFATANTAFEQIPHKLNDANLQRLNEALVVCCLSVTLTGTSTGCPCGVVLSDTVYKLFHTDSFDFMRDTREE